MKKITLILVLFVTQITFSQFIGSWAEHKPLGNDLRARNEVGMNCVYFQIYFNEFLNKIHF